MPSWIGPWELAILLVIILLVFGPKRLPEMGKSLGKGMREFKDGITGKHDEDEDEKDKKASPAELPAPSLVASVEEPAAAATPAAAAAPREPDAVK